MADSKLLSEFRSWQRHNGNYGDIYKETSEFVFEVLGYKGARAGRTKLRLIKSLKRKYYVNGRWK